MKYIRKCLFCVYYYEKSYYPICLISSFVCCSFFKFSFFFVISFLQSKEHFFIIIDIYIYICLRAHARHAQIRGVPSSFLLRRVTPILKLRSDITIKGMDARSCLAAYATRFSDARFER